VELNKQPGKGRESNHLQKQQ